MDYSVLTSKRKPWQLNCHNIYLSIFSDTDSLLVLCSTLTDSAFPPFKLADLRSFFALHAKVGFHPISCLCCIISLTSNQICHLTKQSKTFALSLAQLTYFCYVIWGNHQIHPPSKSEGFFFKRPSVFRMTNP
jgi:hypothetical protein